MATTAWLITALTNLHVGDECLTGYGIIDKSVQRNPITKLPCINSSSLKGALNEFFSNNVSEESRIKVTTAFGSDKSGKTKETAKGSAIFFDANLAALPVPANDGNLYTLKSSEKITSDFNGMCKALQINNAILPEYATDDSINEKCSDESLPIIARNCLENGISKNLWYEQIVPQQTVFYTFMQLDDSLAKILNGSIVQIGANATIGYGYCKFEKLPLENNSHE